MVSQVSTGTLLKHAKMVAQQKEIQVSKMLALTLTSPVQENLLLKLMISQDPNSQPNGMANSQFMKEVNTLSALSQMMEVE